MYNCLQQGQQRSRFYVAWRVSTVAVTQVQQHSFNCPYQAGSRLLHPNSDCANSADCYEIVLVEGDMIVMATDGIFDNLWDKELEKIVIKHTKVRLHPAARWRPACVILCNSVVSAGCSPIASGAGFASHILVDN